MQNKTSKQLLASVLALALCCVMLLGTTFAWFTDTATTAVNTIQSGTLDIDIVDANDTTVSLNGQTLTFADLDSNNLWEPGCTYNTKEFKLINKGNLALKYEISINGIEGDNKLLEAIDWTVTVGGTATALADLKGELLAGATTDAIVLSGHMDENAGNEYQNLTLTGIAINVYATQQTYESDSFGDQYDAAAEYPVATAEELVNALTAGANVTLANDIELAADTNIVLTSGVNSTLDLNGSTLSVKNTRTATNNFIFDVKGGTLNVTNGTVTMEHTGNNMGWNGAATIFDVTSGGVLNLKGVTVKNEGGTDMNFAVHLNNWGNATLIADDCVFDAPYCGVRVFNSGPDMNNVKITNSTIIGGTRAFWVHNYASSDFGGKVYSGASTAYDKAVVDARLNLDIYGNNNTFTITGSAKSPIRYGFNESVFYDADGNIVQ